MDARRVLVTDLDGTLLGDEAALARFRAWYRSNREDFRLAYATGRSRTALARLIREMAIPEPDAAILSVGTEVYDRRGREWPGWRARFGDWNADRARRILTSIGWLEPQSQEAQTRLKASYDAPKLRAVDLDSIRRTLRDGDVDATVIYSSDLHLDVLPAAAGKGEAARTVADAWGVVPEDVLVFGDSGNDLQLYQHGFRGTIVANALPELREAVGPDVYRSPYPHAGGVLDGVHHWLGR